MNSYITTSDKILCMLEIFTFNKRYDDKISNNANDYLIRVYIYV